VSDAGKPDQFYASEVAIIGMACRFPGAKNVEQFWQNLRGAVESISFFSDEDLLSAGVHPDALSDPNYVKAGGVIEGVEMFDASFFGFTPKEAEIIDPQHRLFLECAWEALETAGYDSETYEGLIGLYAGTGLNSYLINLLFSDPKSIESAGAIQAALGNDKDHLTTRVSYKLNLRGPSIDVQTACSTSLVAVHLAYQSLLNGECDLALAGGVSIRIPQARGYYYQEGGILSPDGHCRAFDARAQGTVGSSGVGVVALKRLADAIADRDSIYAIIKGSAVNNDGSMKVGYTAPSVAGQAKVIAEAMAMANLGPESITHIETHGTGTGLGDPIEIEALTQAFFVGTQKKGFCAIGSVKSNIGHADTASGIAGLIKAVLALKHKLLPASLHYEQTNPQIDFANSPFFVNRELCDWKTNGSPRRAGVSSFGIGGTNAHVVLEEAPDLVAAAPCRRDTLIMLSAKSSSALESATSNLVERLKEIPETDLPDVAYTLQVGRRSFPYRRFVLCRAVETAIEALEGREPKPVFTSFNDSGSRPVIFMFPGQGSQHVNMGLEAYQTETAFSEQIDYCSKMLIPQIGLDLRDVLYPGSEDAQAAAGKLNQTLITQPALFVLEYALAKLWNQWGVLPQAMIGHSIGEYVAACLSGVFSLEDGLTIVAVRGRLMQQLPAGTMLTVPLSERELQPLLGRHISLAVVNGPRLCVVSGTTRAIDLLEYQLIEMGVSCRRLRTSHAFHSEMMEPILQSLRQQMESITLNPPRIPFISNLTGTWVTEAAATDPDYWVRHLRQTVRFSNGIGELVKDPARIFLEVGPGRTLSALAAQHTDKVSDAVILTSLGHPHDQRSDESVLLNTLGQLWLAGVQPNWQAFYANQQRRRVPLPTYPFERKRYWIEPVRDRATNNNHLQNATDKPVDEVNNEEVAERVAQILEQQLKLMSAQLDLLDDSL